MASAESALKASQKNPAPRTTMQGSNGTQAGNQGMALTKKEKSMGVQNIFTNAKISPGER